MDSGKEHSHFLEGLILGGLLGAAAGVMISPSGKEIRERLKQKLKELDLEDVVDRFSEAFEAGREEAEKVAQKMEEE